MSKHSNLLWITGLFLGWALDLLFWKQPLGVNFAVYGLLCVLGGCLVLLVNRQAPGRGTLLVFPLILIFAAITAIRAEPMTVFLAICFTLLMLVILAVTYLGGRWLSYGFGDYALQLLRLGGSVVVRPASFSADVRKEKLAGGEARKRANAWPYIRGVVIAIPILAIFAALLASADAAFSSQLDALLRIFQIENLPEYIFRMIYILVAAYALVGVFLHASTQSADGSLSEGTRTSARFLGFTEAVIVLGSVAVLFALFVLVQFRYFFGGQANITVAGFTYSEYARRGFGELVAVAFFSLLMILGLEALTRREGATQRWIFSGLSVAIVALVLVMLVSAYQRLVLYESAYGFSRLRTYTHVALVWIGLLLAAIVLLEVLQRQKAFVPAILAAALGFAVSIAGLNVDGFIARQNVERAVRGEELDVPYLVSLSSDAVPVLAEYLESASTPTAVRDSVGAVLFCHWETDPDRSGQDWRAFTVSRWQADVAMQRVIPRLKSYRLVAEEWPTPIETPGGQSYNCRSSGMD